MARGAVLLLVALATLATCGEAVAMIAASNATALNCTGNRTLFTNATKAACDAAATNCASDLACLAALGLEAGEATLSLARIWAGLMPFAASFFIACGGSTFSTVVRSISCFAISSLPALLGERYRAGGAVTAGGAGGAGTAGTRGRTGGADL